MKLFVKCFLVALVAGVGQLYAQAPAPAPPPAATPPTDAAVRAESLKVQVQADLQHVVHLQTVARKAKDVIKLTCINDKLVRLKPEANMFDSAHKELLGALEQEGAEVQASLEAVEESADRAHKLREEADVCAGEFEIAPSETGNTFTPPEIPDDPTQGLPFETGGAIIEPPSYASPWT